MMKRRPYLILTILYLFSDRGMAYSGDQYQTIVELGALNGIALQCKYFDQTRKMKKALIGALPKRRALGQAFEIATHEAFLEFIKKGEECPQDAVFSARVDRQIKELQDAFSTTTQQ